MYREHPKLISCGGDRGVFHHQVTLERRCERLGHETLGKHERAIRWDDDHDVRHDAPLLGHHETVDRLARRQGGQIARQHPVQPREPVAPVTTNAVRSGSGTTRAARLAAATCSCTERLIGERTMRPNDLQRN